MSVATAKAVGVDHVSAWGWLPAEAPSMWYSKVWFGAKEPVGFTSSWESWQYIKNRQSLLRTRKTLDFMCDVRIALTFSLEDCQPIAAVIRQVAEDVLKNH